MRVKKGISALGRYIQVMWLSARYYFMLRKMPELRAGFRGNRQGICRNVLYDLMLAHGIFISVKGSVEMTEGNIRGIKMLTEGAGIVTMAVTLKQDGMVLTAKENEK
ncbi:MAG: hypothetical protein NC548_58155 [Lachnospiraceae bacterium]|nr:hypothetical protein [Lachnospiraceae bacterium]